MRLLFLSNIYPNPWEPHRGTYNVTLLRALGETHEIRVIAPTAWTAEWQARRRGYALPSERQRIDDNRVVDFPRFYYPPKLLRRHYSTFLWHSVKVAARRAIDDFCPDVVIADWAHPHGEVAAWIAREAGVPSVVIVGGSDVLVLTRRGARRRAVLRSLASCDAVVAVSQDIKRALVTQKVDAERIAVVYRGVDQRIFFPGDRLEARRRLGIEAHTRMLFTAGNLVQVKGLDVLLDAFGRLAPSASDVHLYIAGGGPLHAELERRIAGLGLATRVTLLGPVKNADLPDWYRSADLTVLASRSEGIPNVLVESIACGTPFVASRVGGVPEIADCTLDRLVPPENAPELAKAIAASLEAAPTRLVAARMPRPGTSAAAAAALGELFAGLTHRTDPSPRAAWVEAQC